MMPCPPEPHWCDKHPDWDTKGEQLAVLVAAPKRLQLRRTKGYRKPEGAIVVARPSKWGNPHSHPDLPRDIDRLLSAYEYRAALLQDPRLMLPPPPPLAVTIEDVRRELRGHDLACWCPLSDPCHAAVLLELANS